MDVAAFKASLQKKEPPNAISLLLKALWYEGKGDWAIAHNIVEANYSKDAAWIHAYLHRKEGDNWNANYWYRRAGKSIPAYSLEKEWEILVEYFLNLS